MINSYLYDYININFYISNLIILYVNALQLGQVEQHSYL